MKTIVKQIQTALEEQEVEKVYFLFHQFMDHVTENQIEELIDVASFAFNAGYFEEARQAYLCLTEFEPEESAWTILLAEILVNQGEYDQALSVLYDIPEEDPNYVNVLVVLSQLYQVQGYYDIAERKLLLAKELAPDEAILDFYIGIVLFEAGLLERSILYLEKFLKNSEGETGEEQRARELLVEASLAVGNDEPLQDFVLDTKLESASSDLLASVAEHDFQAGDYHHAQSLYQELLSRDSENYEALLGLSHLQMLKRNYLDAIIHLSKMTESYPYEKEPYFMLGASYASIGQMEKAQEAFKQCYELSPESFDSLQAYVEILIQQEEFEIAQELLEQILEKGMDDGSVYYWLARVKEGLEDFKEALSYYQKASLELENSMEFIVDYVRFLREEGLIVEAKKWLKHGQTMDPLNEDLYALQEYFEA